MRSWTYNDPVDLIWLETARSLGMSVARSDQVYASWDGDRTLTLSTPEGFDPDDCLAQMIFHELCHALVQGPGGLKRADWGLENIDDRHLVREHACHRLQAALADRHGLRQFMGVTTDHRPYYDALPAHPLAPCDDPAQPLARQGWLRATQGDWAEAIERALVATAAIAAACGGFAQPGSLWALSQTPHPLGLGPVRADRSCADCAWGFGEEGQERCHQAEGAARLAHWPACHRWEARLDAAGCGACGACCREAFHQVEVEADSPMLVAHPEWVVHDEYGAHMPRPGGRCAALQGDGRGAEFRCVAYAQRPQSCRDFAPNGENCLEARRRVGLSP